jgi:hypothetical protein
LLVVRIPLAKITAAPFADGRPFLHCRVECDKPSIYTDAMFLVSETQPKSFITSRILSKPYPDEISEVILRTFMTHQECEVKFSRLAVVAHTEKLYGESLPHTLGKDFLSTCSLIQKDQDWFLEMPSYIVKIPYRP